MGFPRFPAGVPLVAAVGLALLVTGCTSAKTGGSDNAWAKSLTGPHGTRAARSLSSQ